MRLWQRAAIMAAVSVCMTAGVWALYGGAETGPAADDRINEPYGPALEPPKETEDPNEPHGPALEIEQRKEPALPEEAAKEKEPGKPEPSAPPEEAAGEEKPGKSEPSAPPKPPREGAEESEKPAPHDLSEAN